MPIGVEEFKQAASGWFSEVEIALFLVDHEGQAFTARELFDALGHDDLLRSTAHDDPFAQFACSGPSTKRSTMWRGT
jgi:hypothetical protein